MRNRPARGGRPKAQPRLQGKVVHLVDHAVDVIAQAGALRLDPAVLRHKGFGAVGQNGQRVGLKPHVAQPLDRAKLGIRQGRRQIAPSIGKKAQGAGGGDAGIQLAQRPSGGVAGVGKDLVTIGRLPGVQRSEIGMGHIDLAAHLHHLRRAGDVLGNIGNCAGIVGDVFAHRAIPARGRLHQHAPLIAQGQGQPVDLGLGRKGQGAAMAQKAADAVRKIGDVAVFKGIFQRQHRHGMGDFAKPAAQTAAHLIGGAVCPFQRGKPRLDGGIAPFQRVVFGIRYLGRVERVIGAVGLSQRLRQPGKLIPGLSLGQLINIASHWHPALPLARPKLWGGAGKV